MTPWRTGRTGQRPPRLVSPFLDTYSTKALLAQVPGGDISRVYKMLLDALAVTRIWLVRQRRQAAHPPGSSARCHRHAESLASDTYPGHPGQSWAG